MKIVFFLLVCFANSIHAATLEFKTSDGAKVELKELRCPNQRTCVSGSKRFLGIGNKATTYMSEIIVRSGSKTYKLDATDMVDPLLQGRNITHKYFDGFCYDELNCSFRGVFGDASGSYAAEWRIINGKPVRSILSDSEDVIQFFLQNIMPPKFE